MSEKFSPALRLADLNDFIAPSQDCVVSLKAIKSKHDKAEVFCLASCFQNQEKVRSSSQPLQTEAVKISLKDCLACRY
ncbi:hypothetical protein GW17_00025823 [Ensete ventricosum]|nr:hypothetical protein GW17_00025823 [Ensete ventricosum]RZR98502.1 hypothetical protein BHM03_00027861 [Ensete ventricosum]